MKKTFIHLAALASLSFFVIFLQIIGLMDSPWYVHLCFLYLTTLQLSNTIHQIQTEKDLQMQPAFLFYEEGILREIF